MVPANSISGENLLYPMARLSCQLWADSQDISARRTYRFPSVGCPIGMIGERIASSAANFGRYFRSKNLRISFIFTRLNAGIRYYTLDLSH
jgi:hypothetical protein